jgi:hypothetical protein
MLMRLSQKLTKGFTSWKEMVMESGDIMKEHGIKVIYAGPDKEDNNSMTAVLYFATTEAMQNFGKNEELLKFRDESGVLLDTVVVVPLSEDTLLNFPE